MGLTMKEHFEEMESNLWRIRLEKERLLIGSDKYDEFIDLYKEAEHYLWRLQELEDLLTAYKRREYLYELYCKRDQEYEKAKGKRTILSILGFTVAYYLFFCGLEGPTGIGMLLAILPALFFAGIHFWVNATIFSWLSQKGREESEHLEHLKKEMRELDTKIANEKRPADQTVELFKKRFEDTERRLENFTTN